MTCQELQSALTDLALDLRWSWNHAADEIWSVLDAELWELTHNPWVILQTISTKTIEGLAADSAFAAKAEQLHREQKEHQESAAWFQQRHGESGLTSVVYFSMEFMLSEALPIYSGGLGNVAGDQLKTASDLGVPVTGIGLLYQQGYFRQEIDANGNQQALYPFNDPGQLPLRPLRDESGQWLRLRIPLPGSDLWVRVWQVHVGRAKLYLLDTNDPANLPSYRGITSELYGGGPELRLRQELILGIAGWRLLRALGIEAEVCHLNEGHAAFAVLERARSYQQDHGVSFELALTVTRAGNIFTTHTPVEAGFDRFDPSLIAMYLSSYAARGLGISMGELLALGRLNPHNHQEPFNMAYLAMRGSRTTNGVSRLHGEVSRKIFRPLFPRWPTAETPISHVTNGIHVPSWDSIQADQLWTKAAGKDRWRGEMETVEPDVCCSSPADIWEMRAAQRKCLVAAIRARLARQLAGRGTGREDLEALSLIFDPDVLTLGFARRFATYKRPNLLLRDRDRLLQILANSDRPVQLVVAGKAHPQDAVGQGLIREWIQFVQRPEVRPHIVFLSDYDMLLAEILVQGVDVWINTPRRPWEACGTSGMKTLVNGGLNLSELDGWWAEAYAPDLGWAIGDGREHDSEDFWDLSEAQELYRLLEQEIVPEFYDRDAQGVPMRWVKRIQQSMARLAPQFSSNRTVRQYTEEYYLPAANAYRRRREDGAKLGMAILAWRKQIARHWQALRFGPLKVEEQGDQLLFKAHVYLDDLDPDAVRVELFTESAEGQPALTTMQRGVGLVGSVGGFEYTATVPADRPAEDYTPRIVPFHEDAAIPLESNEILWQH